MRLLPVLLVLTPLFADDPAGLVVWKGADLKQHATTGELKNSPEYRAVVVHQDRDAEPVLGEVGSALLIVESGEATLVTGGKIQGAAIEDGTKTKLSEGDVVHVPAALPRQILVAPGKQVTYLVLKQQANPGPEGINAAAAPDPNSRPVLGIEVGGGYRACVSSDTSPDGTIFDGFQKVIGYNFMGKTCVWSPVEAPQAGRANAASSLKEKPRIGTDMGGGFRSCVAGDDSPNGTIVDGYRKEFHPGPFGNSCAWEKIK